MWGHKQLKNSLWISFKSWDKMYVLWTYDHNFEFRSSCHWNVDHFNNILKYYQSDRHCNGMSFKTWNCDHKSTTSTFYPSSGNLSINCFLVVRVHIMPSFHFLDHVHFNQHYQIVFSVSLFLDEDSSDVILLLFSPKGLDFLEIY